VPEKPLATLSPFRAVRVGLVRASRISRVRRRWTLMAAARRQAAVLLLLLALAMGAGWAPGAGPRGCAAQGEAVVVASYGEGRLSLKPYDWTYLRGEIVSVLCV